jgi:hypothetical protein
VCLCPTGDPKVEGLAYARLLIEDGDVDAVLVVGVEQADATASAHALLAGNHLAPQAPLGNTLTPQAPFGKGESP